MPPDSCSAPEPRAQSQAAPLAQQDQAFIATAEDGNRAEAEPGQMAEQKANSPAVREFGRWTMTDHSFANKELAALAKRLGDSHQPSHSAKAKASQQTLGGVSGSDFDGRYVRAMVADHRRTIDAFKTEAQSGQNPHRKTFARNLLPVIDQHLREAEELAAQGGTSGSSMPPR